MLLSQEEIKQQTRELWRNNFSHSDEFLDIYFDEKYADENNLTIRHDGNVVASMQLLPYRYTFYGTVLRAGYLNGLCTDKNFAIVATPLTSFTRRIDACSAKGQR